MYQYFIPFYGWIIIHCMDIPYFVYPFIIWWTLGCFHFLAFVNIAIHVFVWTKVFKYSHYVLFWQFSIYPYTAPCFSPSIQIIILLFSLNTLHACPSATLFHGFCCVGSPYSHLCCHDLLQGLSQISLTSQTLSWLFQLDSSSFSSELPHWHQLQYSLYLYASLNKAKTTVRQFTAVSPTVKHFVSLSAQKTLRNILT